MRENGQPCKGTHCSGNPDDEHDFDCMAWAYGQNERTTMLQTETPALTREAILEALNQAYEPREVHGFYADGWRERQCEPEAWTATRWRAEASGHVLGMWVWTSPDDGGRHSEWVRCDRCSRIFDATMDTTPFPICPFRLLPEALAAALALLDLRERLKEYQAMIAEESRDILNDAASRKLFQQVSIGLGSILLTPPKGEK